MLQLHTHFNSDTGIISKPNEISYNSCVQDNSCYALTSGTSFAAPFVTGGLAVIADILRDSLEVTEIVNETYLAQQIKRLYADRSIYGQGLMDLDAATSPVGQSKRHDVTTAYLGLW